MKRATRLLPQAPGAGPVCLPTCQPPPFESLIAGRCLLERGAAPAPTLRPEPPCCCCCRCPGRAPRPVLRPHARARPPRLCPASHARFGRAALPVPQAPSEAGPRLGIGERGCAGVRLPFLPPAHLHTHRQSPGSPGLRSPPGPFPAPLCQRPEQLPPPPCGRESPSHLAPDHHGGAHSEGDGDLEGERGRVTGEGRHDALCQGTPRTRGSRLQNDQ